MSNRITRSQTLLSGIEFLERIDHQVADVQAEIAELKGQIKELKGTRKGQMGELKADGFDPSAVEQMIRERRMDADERRAYQGKLQTYRALLGMLDGTPLGDAAKRALEDELKRRRDEPAPLPGLGDPTDEGDKKPRRRRKIDDGSADPDVEQPPAPAELPEITAETLAAVHQEGAEAARDGKSVLDNPYPGTQGELRSRWEEGWCAEFGSDGMEIPEALRRPDDSAQPNDDAGEGGDGDDDGEGNP